MNDLDWRDSGRQVLARLQGRGGELQLQRRSGHYEIIYNGVFLMADYNGGSERAAVRRGLERLAAACRERRNQRARGAQESPPAFRVLIGGLGMGFSLQEALRSPYTAAVTVAELEPAVIAWNRSYFKELNGNALADPRVTVLAQPFEEIIGAANAGTSAGGSAETGGGPWHLIVVDTDNGSTWLSRPENAAIYSPAGLARIHASLLPGGIACFWCARREESLAGALHRCFQPPVIFEAVREQTGQEAGFYLVEKTSR